jgi:hypothetical protein
MLTFGLALMLLGPWGLVGTSVPTTQLNESTVEQVSDLGTDEVQASSGAAVGRWDCSWSVSGAPVWKNGKVTYQRGGRLSYKLKAGVNDARFDVSGSGWWEVETVHSPKKRTFLKEKHVSCSAQPLNEAARRLAKRGTTPCPSKGSRTTYIMTSTQRSLELWSDRESIRCTRSNM